MPIHETKYDAITDADSNSPFTLPPPFEMMHLNRLLFQIHPMYLLRLVAILREIGDHL